MAQPLWKPVWRLLKNRATYDPAILLSYPEKPPNPNLKRFLHPSAHCGAIYKPSYGRKAPLSPAHPLNQTSSSLSSALTPSHITRNWHNAIQRPKKPQWNDYFLQRPGTPGSVPAPGEGSLAARHRQEAKSALANRKWPLVLRTKSLSEASSRKRENCVSRVPPRMCSRCVRIRLQKCFLKQHLPAQIGS